MMQPEDEERALRSVALQNAQSILAARQRAEQELRDAKEALERKTAELAQALSMTRATLESATNGILATSDDGRITGHNANYARLWRAPRELLEAGDHRRLVEHLSLQFDEPARYLERIEEIYAQAPAETFDLLEFSDGRVFERFTRVQFVNDQPVGRVWSFRDITDRIRADEERKQLLESERAARAQAERTSELKDDFLATLSHELRTPLSAILGWATILRRGTVEPAELKQGLEVIERNARVQTQLIEDLLDMSRITSGKLRLDVQPVDLALIVEAAMDTVKPAAAARGVRLERMVDPGAGPVSGDPSRLQQIVWNLLSNAIKFTPKGGRVQIVVARIDSHIEISVADTGIGIATEFLPLVFDRFRQADASTTRVQGGLGLGLAIVRSLVELHGGSVQVASAGASRGTTFTVHLPMAVVQPSAWGDRRHPSSPSGVAVDFKAIDLSGITILVVDDERDARELIRRLLEECRADVVVASSAAEAVTLVERRRPHVLISDIGMPDSDGYELLRRVRALGPERGGRLHAIALTAFARSEDRTRALHAGFLAHVSKPVEPAELVATIASVVGRTGDELATPAGEPG